MKCCLGAVQPRLWPILTTAMVAQLHVIGFGAGYFSLRVPKTWASDKTQWSAERLIVTGDVYPAQALPRPLRRGPMPS
jgi:hypothetical protein